MLMSSLIYIRPLTKLLICHWNCLLSAVILLFLELITWAAKERLKKASGWHIEAIYIPLAHYTTYYSFIINISQTIPLKLMVIATLLR
jgi:hypothetical protein